MIEIDDDGQGRVDVWFASELDQAETNAGRWLLLARGVDQLGALVDAEKLVRDDLMRLQELLQQARQQTGRPR
jgi:hypothetical protein